MRWTSGLNSLEWDHTEGERPVRTGVKPVVIMYLRVGLLGSAALSGR